MNEPLFYYLSTPYHGHIRSYGGGGYVQLLGNTIAEAMDVINDLQTHKWINDGYVNYIFQF